MVVGSVVAVGVSRSGGHTRSSGGRSPATGASGSARFTGRVWYSRAIVEQVMPWPIVPRVMAPGQRSGPVPVVFFRTRTSYETWIASDGSSRQRRVILSDSFASSAGRKRWLAAGQPPPATSIGTGSDGLSVGSGEFPAGLDDSPSDPGDSLFSAQQLLQLPGTPEAVSRVLLRAQRALIARQEQAYVQASPRHAAQVARLMRLNDRHRPLAFAVLDSVSSLAISSISNELRHRLVSAASLTPGVTASSSGPRLTLTVPGVNGGAGVVFDRRTGRLLQGMPQAPGTIVAQGNVDSLRALPHGLAPIPARHLPAPPVPTLRPVTGTRHTTFTLELPAATVRSAAGAPELLAEIMGPTGPDCHYQYSKPGIAQIPTGTSNGANEMFAVSPTTISRSSWCPGRYGIQVAAGKDATLGTGQGSTAYFTVR